EHAMLARSVADDDRTRAFARYSLTGALATAAGSLMAATPDLLVAAGFERLASFEAMFYAYAALGLLGALLYRRLPHAQAEQQAAWTLAPHRLQARCAVQPGFLRRWTGRAIASGTLAVPALRPVAVGREPVLLLDQRAHRILLSRRCAACRAHRPDQYDGVHP